ncbi:MAG TPA: type I methionyl aminopeptidase [Ktedonobacteraceae bacterium]|nr:type I methionyl aminopeptidase [Ktedonobacteraceae bacterium]
MAIILKSKSEIESIRQTGRIVAEILAELRTAVRPGITTAGLDALAAAALRQRGAHSSSLGYMYDGHRYPASFCTSVNDEVVHSIPGSRVLQEGDIITLDLAAVYDGWHADAAITVPVGRVSVEAQRLIHVTQNALDRGIAAARAANRLQDISRAVQNYVEGAGFSVVRNYGGHGVGRAMHEDPAGILNYVLSGYDNPLLRPGMVIAIEPMVNMGAKETRVLDDHWTVVTLDGSYAAHFEHTVAITGGDADILTL